MKYYFTILLAAFVFIAFGQLTPKVELKIDNINRFGQEIFPLMDNGVSDYTVILTADNQIQYTVFDEKFAVKHQGRMTNDIRKRQIDFYYRDDKFIYRHFVKDRRYPSPEGLKIDKETSEVIRKEYFKGKKREKYCAFFQRNDSLALVSYQSKEKSLNIYRIKGVDVFDKFSVSGNVLKYWSEFFFELKKPKRIYGKNEVLYFIREVPEKKDLAFEMLKIDLKNKALSSRIFHYDLSGFRKNKLTRGEYYLKNIFSVEIIGDIVFQVFMVREGFFVNLFDLKTGELMQTKELILEKELTEFPVFSSVSKDGEFTEALIRSTERDGTVFTKRKGLFSEYLLNTGDGLKLENHALHIGDQNGVNKAYEDERELATRFKGGEMGFNRNTQTFIKKYNLGPQNQLVFFGKMEREENSSYYPSHSYSPSISTPMGTIPGQRSVDLRKSGKKEYSYNYKFGYFELGQDNIVNSTNDYSEDLNNISRLCYDEYMSNDKRYLQKEEKIVISDGKFRLVSYDRLSKILSIY